MRKHIDHYEVPADLIFRTEDIKERHGLKCSVVLDPEQFKSLAEGEKILSLSLKLEFFLGDKEIFAEGSFKTKVSCNCARCLKEYQTLKTGEFSQTFGINTELIDIMNELREALIIASEIKHLCSPDCKGLCQTCGTDLNAKKCGCIRKPPSPFEILKEKFNSKDSKK